MTDPVNHPPHYTRGSIECIDALEASATTEEFLGFCRLTAMAYLWRAPFKGNTKEDIEKARWYQNRAIEHIEKKNKRAVPVTPPQPPLENYIVEEIEGPE